MPNTLAHLGVAGLATNCVFRDADLRWVYLGAVIPDFPWISQKAVRFFLPDMNPYDLRLYVIIQATLFFSLILSGFFALISTCPLRNFVVMGMGAFLHLFLDAFQIKWANGVHFFAPFDWRLIQFGFFWPDSFPTYSLTILGLLYLILNWRKSAQRPWPLKVKSKKHVYAAVVVAGAYFLLPISFFSGPLDADNHFVQTLRNVTAREGKLIEFDRAGYERGTLHAFGETFDLKGFNIDQKGLVSIRGVFIDRNTIQVHTSNVHSIYFRDNASYLGLALVALLWGLSGVRALKQ